MSNQGPLTKYYGISLGASPIRRFALIMRDFTMQTIEMSCILERSKTEDEPSVTYTTHYSEDVEDTEAARKFLTPEAFNHRVKSVVRFINNDIRLQRQLESSGIRDRLLQFIKKRKRSIRSAICRIV